MVATDSVQAVVPSLERLHLPDAITRSSKPGEATPAARTAALLSEWQAMTPGVWDAPCQFGAFVPTRVPEAPIAAAAVVLDKEQAANNSRALLWAWQSACRDMQPEGSLTWKEDLTHQFTAQQGDQLLSNISSLEYGK